VDACEESGFLKIFLRGHVLKETAIKMELTRLRHDLGDALQAIGAPYSAEHFLPFASHGAKRYYLAGNYRLVHIPHVQLANAGLWVSA